MSTSLNNRKEFKKSLTGFLDFITISPELKYNIQNNQVTQQYALHCETLMKKMEFAKQNQLESSKAYQ